MTISTDLVEALYESVSGVDGGSPSVFTITITSPLSVGDTITIGDVIFTFVDAPSTTGEVARGNTAIQAATTLLTALEASTDSVISDFEFTRSGNTITGVARHNGDSFNDVVVSQETPARSASGSIVVSDGGIGDTFIIAGLTFALSEVSIAANDILIGEDDNDTAQNIRDALDNYGGAMDDYTFSVSGNTVHIVANDTGPSGNTVIAATGSVLGNDLVGGVTEGRVAITAPSGGQDDTVRNPIVSVDENGETKDFEKIMVCLIALVETALRTHMDDPTDSEGALHQVRLDRNRLKRFLAELSMFVSASVDTTFDDRERVADMFIDRFMKRTASQKRYT